MKNILILFAHPAFEKSRVNALLVQGLSEMSGVTFHDLYQEYPELDIDRAREQRLLSSHDIIIFHHPFFWYSGPAILKQWQELVLSHGWAYGRQGTALRGKYFLNVLTTGGQKEFYHVKGQAGRFTIRQLLAPFEQTASMCKMTYLPPFVVHGAQVLTTQDIVTIRDSYYRYLSILRDETIDFSELMGLDYLNDYPPPSMGKGKP